MYQIKDIINSILCGDSLMELRKIPNESIDTIITSPPYWGLRDYGVDGQFGLEKTPEEYVAKMVEVFREVKRVLKKEGTLWLNLGDSYGGSGVGLSYSGFTKGPNAIDIRLMDMRPAIAYTRGKWNKQLMGIPWRVAFALQADGWYFRQDIIWAKPNPMPESVTDRCTKSHEYVFLMSKSPKYYFDTIKEPAINAGNRAGGGKKISSSADIYAGQSKNHLDKFGETIQGEFRNKRSVWTVATKPFKEAHFATFPEDLIVPMVLAGCPKDGIVLDPFMGSGTTALVAKKLGRNYLGIELNPAYIKMAEKRLRQDILL